MVMDTIPVDVGGGIQLFHKKTGKPIPLVREFTGEVRTWTCDECGATHRERVYKYRTDKRFSPANIEERIVPPTRCFLPLYEE